jgi:adenine-specific DNA-methyltransferase
LRRVLFVTHNQAPALPFGIYDDHFLLGVLNSSLINWYFLNFLTEKMHFYPDDAKSLPIVKISNASQQKPIVALVTQILTVTKDPNYSGNPDKQAKVSALEREIDKMVYDLYGLTPEETALVEGLS